jgi:hypothetical protein
MNKNDKRKQIIYQKTDFNNASICQLNNIMKCGKCKKNNMIVNDRLAYQLCLFCGNPNYIMNNKFLRTIK